MNDDSLTRSITNCIKFLSQNQNKDGSFNSYSSKSRKFSTHETFVTTFYTSLVLINIAKISDPRLDLVKRRGCKFLLKEKDGNSTFNYWAKNFIKHKTEPCPNDLDDTACAMTALISCNRDLIVESDLAKITRVLIGLESQIGGPYYTWILPPDSDLKWKDTDLAVNANICFFLSQLDIKLPSISKLIEQAILKGKYLSTYYPDVSTIYFISRAYDGPMKNKLVRYIKRKNSTKFKNPLECALLGSSLVNLGEPVESIMENVEFLLANQKTNGSFGVYTFINERSFNENCKRFSGSESFTVSLVLELLTRFQRPAKTISSVKKYDDNLVKEVSTHARGILQERFKSSLIKQFDSYLEKIAGGDLYDMVVLQPFVFVNSLKIKSPSLISKKFLLDLASAGIFGWVAYTIFDNISDEQKDLDKFSLALVCHRELEKLFCKNNPGFGKIFKMFLDRVDYANYYEFKHSQILNNKIPSKKIYPNADSVSEKSIAHSLIPLAVIYKMGYGSDTDEFKQLYLFYLNYLTARQLNDDAHDWEADLNQGRINYVGELLIRDFEKKFQKDINLKKDMPRLQKLFWDRTVLKVCHLIESRIKKAKNRREALSGLLEQNYLEDKLNQLLLSAQTAIRERNKTQKFLSEL